MFALGQTVYHKTRALRGVVEESDAAITYLRQDNGVEIDFPTRELTVTPPATPTFAGPAPIAAPTAATIRTFSMRDITPEHEKVLSIIPTRTLQAVAALWERQPNASRFSALNAAQRLNFIAEASEIPYKTMRLHIGEPSHLGLLMARGLADRAAVAKKR
jgi:hypothetical protein